MNEIRCGLSIRWPTTAEKGKGVLKKEKEKLRSHGFIVQLHANCCCIFIS
jgi:hypothetical protein